MHNAYATDPIDFIKQLGCSGTIATDLIIAGVGAMSMAGIFTKPNILGSIALLYGLFGAGSKITGQCG